MYNEEKVRDITRSLRIISVYRKTGIRKHPVFHNNKELVGNNISWKDVQERIELHEERLRELRKSDEGYAFDDCINEQVEQVRTVN